MAKQIKLVKSLIGRKDDQIATAHSLGLKKIGQVSIQPDNEQTKGKINKISHLVEVKEVHHDEVTRIITGTGFCFKAQARWKRPWFR